MTRLNSKKGVTLIEGLFSVTLLVIALCSVIPTLAIGRMGVIRTKHRIEVRNILRAEMEELKNTAYASIQTAGPFNVTIDIGPDLTSGTADDLVGQETINVIDRNGYKEVSVTLAWQEIGFGSTKTVSKTIASFINTWSIYQ